MELNLSERPKNVTIIQGFPGFGMVGSISTEFLIKHLETREIGTVRLKEIAPILAIHGGKIVPPVGIYYNEKYNLVILNFLTKGADHEWGFADLVHQLANEFEAKEIIAIEGVTSQLVLTKQDVFTFSNDEKHKEKLKSQGFKLLEEGIILGVSAALLLNKNICNLTAFFSLTASTMPDSNASAEIIKSLDKYLNLDIDYNPLYDQAREFEEKIKKIMEQSQQAVSENEKSMLNYVS
jgi:uncharacterized protein